MCYNMVMSDELKGTLEPGEILKNRFRIASVIGQGAYGTVYLADDLSHENVQWAVKEIWEHNLNDDERLEALDRFNHEVTVLKTLNHPGIPKVVDSFSTGPSHYLVMEYIEGRTLESMQDDGPLDEKTVAAWAVKICDILDYLHNLQPEPIIFRDLKPGNIMITAKGRVLLIDFGIARFFNPQKSKDTMVLGTPGFAPPEQYGKAQSDNRSDIYALGATLYHLLSGQDLFRFNFSLPLISTFNRAVSSTMERILIRALDTDPANRFQDVKDMKEQLKKCASGQAAPAVAPPPVPPAAPHLVATSTVYPQMAQAPTSPQNYGAFALLIIFTLVLGGFLVKLINAPYRGGGLQITSVNGKDANGHTPLYRAMTWGYPDTAISLINRGADVNEPAAGEENPPLYMASFCNYPQIVTLLLKKGARIDATNKNRRTALICASMRGNRECVKILLYNQAAINIQDINGWSALFFALLEGHMDIADNLMAHGASANCVTSKGETYPHYFMIRNMKVQTAYLLQHGASLTPPKVEK
jgi:tRNA A-37 threonylcarbamoyl transferase component Bud32